MPNANDFLIHYGVKGQKKGERRYQDENGQLTEEGRRHYGIGEKQNKRAVGSLVAVRKRVGEVATKATNAIKSKTKSKVSDIRGPQHMSDAELNERVKRMRTEAEYTRLKKEIEGGGNQNNGGKSDKKHPMLNKAIAIPVATAIGVGVAAIAKEKVSAFLDHRAATKMSTFMKASETATDASKLGKLFETARRAADSAGHPVQGGPNISSIVKNNAAKAAAVVKANKDRKIAQLVIKNSGNVSDFIKRTSLDAPVLKRRMRRFNTYL